MRCLLALLWLVPTLALAQLYIPQQSDFTSQGIVLSPGTATDWDEYIGDERANLQGHITPMSVIKIAGTYYLYYGGADGLRGDNGPANRAIGLATSTDGLEWTKHGSNPLLTYNPVNDEEGYYSATALYEGGTVYLYTGRMFDTGGGGVGSSIVLYTSSDGVTFGSGSVLIASDDGTACGTGALGAEVFPTVAYKSGSNWYVYYVGKGGGLSWGWCLGVGTSSTTIGDTTYEVGDPADEYRGPAGNVVIDGTTLYTPVHWNKSNDWEIEIRSGSTSTPQTMTTVERTWDFDDDESATVYHDASINKWFVFRVDTDADAVRLETYQGDTPGTVLGTIVIGASIQ